MKPLSQDKREIIIAANSRGESPSTIALWVGASRASVYNILNLHKATNGIVPKPYPGRQSSLTQKQISEICKTVKGENDITLDELIEKLGLPIKKSRLSVILIKMGFSFKKRLFIQKSSGARMSKKNAETGREARIN
jgi:transposase